MDAPRAPPVRPAKAVHDEAHGSFRRGTMHPKAVPWFGIRSFYGHLWHLVASAIATQDIDSRDWMHADSPAGLTKSVARTIDGDARDGAPSVAEGDDRLVPVAGRRQDAR